MNGRMDEKGAHRKQWRNNLTIFNLEEKGGKTKIKDGLYQQKERRERET